MKYGFSPKLTQIIGWMLVFAFSIISLVWVINYFNEVGNWQRDYQYVDTTPKSTGNPVLDLARESAAASALGRKPASPWLFCALTVSLIISVTKINPELKTLEFESTQEIKNVNPYLITAFISMIILCLIFSFALYYLAHNLPWLIRGLVGPLLVAILLLYYPVSSWILLKEASQIPQP